MADQIGRRGIVFLISDCFDDLEPTLAGLRHLRFRGHEVILFHVLHPDEVKFPLDGNIRFIGLEGFEELMTRPHLLRPAYLRIVEKYLKEIQKGCDGSGVDYVPTPDESLAQQCAGGVPRATSPDGAAMSEASQGERGASAPRAGETPRGLTPPTRQYRAAD